MNLQQCWQKSKVDGLQLTLQVEINTALVLDTARKFNINTVAHQQVQNKPQQSLQQVALRQFATALRLLRHHA